MSTYLTVKNEFSVHSIGRLRDILEKDYVPTVYSTAGMLSGVKLILADMFAVIV